MKTILAALVLIAVGCNGRAPLMATVSAPRSITLVDSTHDFASMNAWTANVGKAMLVYVASDARDDDEKDPAPTAISLGINRDIDVGTFDAQQVALGYRDLPSFNCSKWSGTAEWKRHPPDFEISIDATCTQAGQPSLRFVADVTGYMAP